MTAKMSTARNEGMFKILVSAGVVVFVLAAVLPSARQSWLLGAAIEQKKKAFQKYRQLIENRQLISQAYNSVFPSAPAGEKSGPVVSAMSELEAAAKKSGIKLVALKEKGLPSSAEFVFDVNLEAKKPDFIRFIYELGNCRNLFRINNFNLKIKENAALLQSRMEISCTPPSS